MSFYRIAASLLVVLLFWAAGSAIGQSATDSTKVADPKPALPPVKTQGLPGFSRKDSVIAVKKKEPFQPNAKRAGLYSAILPGLGQLYNRQYWKVPVIYAGLAVAGYFITDNLNNYQSFRKAYIGRINNPYPTDKYVDLYSIDQLQQLQNEYGKFLNMSVLFTGIGYTLQIVEAMTGAHLKNFDISRDISMQMLPIASPGYVGLGMVVKF